ncbi:MAG: class I tRNA ligase family protein, partial [Patescibacteria group bacterium]
RSSVNTGLSLKEHGMEGVKEVNFYPFEYQKRARDFLEGIKDWCISRNLLWGHQFPVWYNITTNPEKQFYTFQDWKRTPHIQEKLFIGSKEELHVYLKSNNLSSASWVQEDRRLDTWFSSSLWPLTTFGYQDYLNGDHSNDFATFYPTTTMVTAKEIFYIWICRMITLSKYFTSKLPKESRLYNSIPFKDMIVHPTILDDQGKKMSKSLGNGMDPVAQIEKYSSDSLRMAMLSGMIPGRNMRLGGNLADKLCEKYRNFGNKLWNIIRFLESKNALNLNLEKTFDPTISGWWLLKKYQSALDSYEKGFENYQLGESLEAVYHFVWDELAPWSLEYLKVNDNDLPLVSVIVNDLIQILSPFMPFETEVLWNELKQSSMAQNIRSNENLDYFFKQLDLRSNSVLEFEEVIETIESLRSAKGLFNIPAGEVVNYFSTSNAIVESSTFIDLTTKCKLLAESAPEFYSITKNTQADLISKIIDKSAEVTRTNTQIESIKKQILTIENMLQNRDFLNNATADIIKQKHDDLKARSDDLILLNNKITLLS